ncbi:MAG: hypothetical protein ABSB88_04375 [Bryobacteraceae bacterium]|jgi:hypothetical protein
MSLGSTSPFPLPEEPSLFHLRRHDHDLLAAREIQKRFLPGRLPHVAGLDYFGDCQPAGEVGADFFDLRSLPGNQLAVSVGDVSAHDITAAILMSGIQAFLRCVTGGDSGVILRAVDELNRVAIGTASAIGSFWLSSVSWVYLTHPPRRTGDSFGLLLRGELLSGTFCHQAPIPAEQESASAAFYGWRRLADSSIFFRTGIGGYAFRATIASSFDSFEPCDILPRGFMQREGGATRL